jgi:hypothetical protein
VLDGLRDELDALGSLVSISSCLVRTRLSHRWKGR